MVTTKSPDHKLQSGIILDSSITIEEESPINIILHSSSGGINGEKYILLIILYILHKNAKVKKKLLFRLVGINFNYTGLFMPLFSKLFIDEVIMHDKRLAIPINWWHATTTIIYGQLIWLLNFIC